jgi:ribonuclease HI
MDSFKWDNLELWFDGACEPVNPGGTASCGWIVYRVEGNEKERIASGSNVVRRGGPLATNNYAEWCGVGCGLRWMLDNMKDECHLAKLIVIGDSQLVLNQLSGKWKCKKPHLQALKRRVDEIIQQLKFERVEVRWIPREQNKEADTLSKLNPPQQPIIG